MALLLSLSPSRSLVPPVTRPGPCVRPSTAVQVSGTMTVTVPASDSAAPALRSAGTAQPASRAIPAAAPQWHGTADSDPAPGLDRHRRAGTVVVAG